MQIITQDQPFFPKGIQEKFRFIQGMGFDGFEMDGKLLVNNLEEVQRAIAATGLPVASACGGYSGWIGDFDEEKRLNGLAEIAGILRALQEVGGKGMVAPAAWGMFSYRLPPMVPPRNKEADKKAVTESLGFLNQIAEKTETLLFLEPLNRYEDHMINTVAQARSYIDENGFKQIKVVGDVYHMNIEEDHTAESLFHNRDIIRHIHLADNQRYQPGSGSIDFKELFGVLKKMQYEGLLTLECRVKGENLKQAYAESLHFLKELEN